MSNRVSGSKIGGNKVVETRVQKYMSQGYNEIEARKMVSDDYRRIGAKGGSVKGTTCGFAADSARASTAGKYSRKGYKLIERTETSGKYRRMSDGAIVEIKY